MSGYLYTDQPKPASAHTREANRALAERLGLDPEAPENQELELELAASHLIRGAGEVVIRDDAGSVIWDLGAFRFLKEPRPDDRVTPSLWLNGRANLLSGICEVRGFDLANLTLVRSVTGWIVLDCTTNVETARAAMAFASETLGEDIPSRVRAIIIATPIWTTTAGSGASRTRPGWGGRCPSTCPPGMTRKWCGSTSLPVRPCPAGRSSR